MIHRSAFSVINLSVNLTKLAKCYKVQDSISMHFHFGDSVFGALEVMDSDDGCVWNRERFTSLAVYKI